MDADDWRAVADDMRKRDRERIEGVTHLCPPTGQALTPCCGRSPFELPRTDRITLDPNLVTCVPPADPKEQ